MTATDRRDATDAQFADELARLNRLDVADESAVERVAAALWEAQKGVWVARWVDLSPASPTRGTYRDYARAAIAALKPAPGTDTSGQAGAPSCACGGPCVHDGSLIEALREQQGLHEEDPTVFLPAPPLADFLDDAGGQAVQRFSL